MVVEQNPMINGELNTRTLRAHITGVPEILGWNENSSLNTKSLNEQKCQAFLLAKIEMIESRSDQRIRPSSGQAITEDFRWESFEQANVFLHRKIREKRPAETDDYGIVYSFDDWDRIEDYSKGLKLLLLKEPNSRILLETWISKFQGLINRKNWTSETEKKRIYDLFDWTSSDEANDSSIESEESLSVDELLSEDESSSGEESLRRSARLGNKRKRKE